jgi:hypothetical protein
MEMAGIVSANGHPDWDSHESLDHRSGGNSDIDHCVDQWLIA